MKVVGFFVSDLVRTVFLLDKSFPFLKFYSSRTLWVINEGSSSSSAHNCVCCFLWDMVL